MASAGHQHDGPDMLSPEPEARPPQQVLYELVTGHYISRAIYVAAKLGIADLLREGPQHYTRLAELAGAHPPSLRRVLVLLASVGIVAQLNEGFFGLTPVGEFLRSDVPGSRRAQALLLAGPVQYRSWSGLFEIVKTGRTPSGKSAFQFFAKYPGEAIVFNEGMTSGSTETALAVTAAYDFSPFRTIVDLGGGHGVLLATILNKNPDLRGILFDLPEVAGEARRKITAAGLAKRCEVIGGDFFASVPGSADAYILKSVIHDWDDDQASAILQKVRDAMAENARLILVELVLPAHMDATAEGRIAAGSDVNLLVNVGGRERTESEFRDLLNAARFRLTKILPTETPWYVIEGVPL